MQRRKILLFLFIAAVLLVLLIFLIEFNYEILRIATPFFMAIPIVYIVKPLSERLVRRKIPKVPAILLVYLFFILAGTAAGVFIIPELAGNIRELMNTLPDLTSQYQRIVDNMVAALKSSRWSDDVKAVIFNEMQKGVSTVQTIAAEALKKSLEVLLDAVKIVFDLTVGMVIAYYIIKDSKQFKEVFLSLLPRHFRKGITGVGKEINLILSGFIQGQLLTALIVGIMETIGLMIVGVKYPLVLGMVGGIANIIPYFGPYIGALPAIAIAFVQSPVKVIWAIAVFLVVQQIDNSYISPKIIEGKLGLHPVATILAVLAGGEFFGIIGMLVAVPVVAIVRAIVRRGVDVIA